MGIAGIGHIIQSTSVFGPFLYGVGVLLLKPFGLHHILLAMVRFTPAGGIEMVNGRSGRCAEHFLRRAESRPAV